MLCITFVLYMIVNLNVVYLASPDPILIVTSFDAFGYNFLNEKNTPNLWRLRSEGSYTKYLKNNFITKTFLNHFTMATGLFPEYHGVLGNSLYDPKLDKIISYSKEMFSYDPATVPIWTLNELSSSSRHSGSMMWPGGEFPYLNKNITYRQPLDFNMDFKTRIDIAMSWLTDPKQPANFVMLYFEEPDSFGHAFGVDSKEFLDKIKYVDEIAKYLEEKLFENNLFDRAHVVHASDHGMINLLAKNIINVTSYLETNTYQTAESSPILHIIPNKDQKVDDFYSILIKAKNIEGHFNVYRKQDLFERWHYKNCLRTPPLMLVADPGYAFDDLYENINYFKTFYKRPVLSTNNYGLHGYDNNIIDMYGFFMARGPKLKTNYEIEPFENTDLYSLFVNILELSPISKTNGSFARVGPMLNLNMMTRSVKKNQIYADGDSFFASFFTKVLMIMLPLVALILVGILAIWLMKCKQASEAYPIARYRHKNEFSKQGEVHSLLVSDSDA